MTEAHIHTTAPAAPTPTIRITAMSTTIVILMTVSAFGPYVVGSVRTEQLVVYGLACLILPMSFVWFRPYEGWWFFIPWCVLFAVAMIGVVFPTRGPMPWEAGQELAGIDNLLLPLTIMLLVWSIVPPADALRALNATSRVVVWAAAANGLLSVSSILVDLSPLLRSFWSDQNGSTVADRAATMGRFGGIFNQPAEAGMVYGIGGILSVYCYRRQPGKMSLALILICLGGMVSVSKVFLLGGIPLALLYWWRTSIGGKFLSLFSGAVVAVGIARSGLFEQWTGFNRMINRFIPTEERDPIAFYTAGRWNTDSTLLGRVSDLLDYSPMAGVGAAGWAVAYDSGWVEALIVAGLIGLVSYAIIILGAFRLAQGGIDRERRQLALFLAIFLFGSSFGISPLTANRVATIVWLLLTLLVLAKVHSSTIDSEDYSR